MKVFIKTLMTVSCLLMLVVAPSAQAAPKGNAILNWDLNQGGNTETKECTVTVDGELRSTDSKGELVMKGEQGESFHVVLKVTYYEKWASGMGGSTDHRYSVFDMAVGDSVRLKHYDLKHGEP